MERDGVGRDPHEIPDLAVGGSHGLRPFENIIGGQPITGVEDLGTLFETLLTIALGMIVGVALTKLARRVVKQPIGSPMRADDTAVVVRLRAIVEWIPFS